MRKPLFFLALVSVSFLLLFPFFFINSRFTRIAQESGGGRRGVGETRPGEIRDSSLKVSFIPPVGFEALPREKLIFKNPHFLYDFSPRESAAVECYLSQTVNPKEGSVTADYLHEGLVKEFRSNFGKIEELGWQVLPSSDPAVTSARISLRIGESPTLLRLVEVVRSEPKTTIFLACQSPESLYGTYEARFEGFFGSLKVIGQ